MKWFALPVEKGDGQRVNQIFIYNVIHPRWTCSWINILDGPTL